MKEILIEDDHVKRARAEGAVCIKGKVPGRAAFPDQLILKDKSKAFYWVEFKSPTGTLQDDQVAMIEILRKKGHVVYICNSFKDSSLILDSEFGS